MSKYIFSGSIVSRANVNVTLYAETSAVPFSPTNGKDQVKTSIKFGSQYGWGEQLNCRIFITLFSYFNTAAVIGAGNHQRQELPKNET